MNILKCLTCGVNMDSISFYHIHNLNFHTVEELSATILKVLLRFEEIPAGSGSEHLIEDSKIFKKNSKKPENKKNNGEGGFSRECMDEVIELGTIEGDDNLTVQSLFLKSNFTPNSSHIIEVKEKKSQDVIKVLSKGLNASVVHFQNEYLRAGIPGCLNKQFSPNSKLTNGHSDSPKRKSKRRTRKIISNLKKKKDLKTTLKRNNELYEFPNSIFGNNNSQREKNPKTNVKIVLRSGRTIKANQKYEDYVYYDNFKESSHKNILNSVTSTVAPTTDVKGETGSINQKNKVSENVNLNQHITVNLNQPNSLPSEPTSSKLFDLFSDDLSLGDWNFRNELDISVEDLDLSGFDDFGSTLPENQILTIENLFQELDGGGSIEISNIIKENNVDSDTLVLDALSQNVSSLCNDHNENLSIFNKQSKKDMSLNISEKAQKPVNTCIICNKSYTNKKHYETHLEKYHGSGNKMLYNCTTCNSVFTFLATFEKHMKEHNPFQTFICEECGRSFKSLTNLKIHFALHKKEKIFQCHLCPNKYLLKYSYLNHLKIHKEKKYHCEKCEKHFSQKLHFNKHMERHKNGKYLGWSADFKCNYCSDKKSVLELQSFFKSTDINFTTCIVCKKGLYKRYLLLNSNFVKSQQSVDSPRKECKICRKNVKNLQKHVRETHLSNPVVQCDICKHSVKKSSLNAHKFRLHKGIVTKCDHCNKNFKNALALKEHLNKVKKLI